MNPKRPNVLVESVEAVRRQRARRDLDLQPPCPESEIDRLCRASEAAFGVRPPDRHLDLLRLTNGFWEDGLHVYASRITEFPPPSNAALNGFVEATQLYRENFSGYFAGMLVFAEDDAYIYALDLAAGRFVKQAYVEAEPTATFATFDELFEWAVRSVVREFGE